MVDDLRRRTSDNTDKKLKTSSEQSSTVFGHFLVSRTFVVYFEAVSCSMLSTFGEHEAYALCIYDCITFTS